jgi:phosphoribosyl-AMP cyclohydrolase
LVDTRSRKEETLRLEKMMRDINEQTIRTVLETLSFNADGLIPAIAQQHDTGEVLMMAWMNREAVETTLREGRGVYWSRSRGALWRKGESSGQVQTMIELRWDCDNDTILLVVDQAGVACHTGRRNCFFNAVRDGEVQEIAEIVTNPDDLYGG